MKTFQRLFWPDMTVDGNTNIALWLGYVACGWNAFTHLIDVVMLWSTINNLRSSVAKLPPLNFDEFLSGNTLVSVELGLFVAALSLLAILIIFKPIWGFAINLVWTCLNVALYIVFFTFSNLTFVTFLVPILRLWLAVQGLRGVRNYRANRLSLC